MTIQKSLGAQSIISKETSSPGGYFPQRKCIGKSSCSPSVKPSMGVASSCEFHVGSDHGIQLIVDLNSNPSEWMKKLENEVHMCQDPQNYLSRTGSFHQELGRLGNVYKRREGPLHWFPGPGGEYGHTNVETKEGGHVEGDNSEVSVDLERVEGIKQDREPSFEHLGLSDVDPENQTVSSSVSCSEEGKMNIDFDIPDAQERTARSENCEKSNQKNGGGLVNSSQVYLGCMESGSAKTQLSTVCHQHSASCVPQENEGLENVVEGQQPNLNVQHGRSLNSTHLNCESSGNQQPLASAEELERCSLVPERGVSVCSQPNDPPDSIEGGSQMRQCNDGRDGQGLPKLDAVESSERLQLKRQFVNDESCCDCARPDAKVLRSSNYAVGKVHLRRSSRLVPKNQPTASK